ncbi:ABC-2 type transport system permease protein [Tamaricihabitans halophyticus]|uniref:Transport permease protein n=1 Tax=Tamaricihabitans halophyticus TaxID=1262583 RepID=A0A4R2QKG4_9PSEU|nr:ABC transporter permease [Tamaricihabitans halophyticus]TCP49922.1 ABC-2 type transport system permease protein [Tamaricihabitans halophyticus]
MSALYRLAAVETKLFFREPMSVFFTLGIPPLLLVILGVIPSFREPVANLADSRVIDVYTPIIVALSIALFAFTGLPQQFATYREKGVLRRMRITPVKPRILLGAQLLMCALLSTVTMLAVLAIARVAFDVALPEQLPGFLGAYLLSALAMLAIGLLVAAWAPSGKGAGAIGTVLLFPSMFFAGLWIPRASMNDVLRTISDLTPLGAAVQSLQDTTTGQLPQLLHLTVLLAWTVLAAGLAARYFRWE